MSALQRSMRSTSASSMYAPERMVSASGDPGVARLMPLKTFLVGLEDKQRAQERQQAPPWAPVDADPQHAVRSLFLCLLTKRWTALARDVCCACGRDKAASQSGMHSPVNERCGSCSSQHLLPL